MKLIGKHCNFTQLGVIFGIIVFFLFLQGNLAYSAMYYVATTGSDSNTGTLSAPWKTIQHASNIMVAGDTTIVQPGTYGGFYAAASGTASLPITFRASGTVTINTGANSSGDLVRLDGQNYLIVDGFTVTAAPRFGIRLVNGIGLVAKNNIAHHNGESNIFSAYAKDVQILNNTTYNAGSQHGIYVSNSNVRPDNPIVRGNVVYGNTQNGIQLNGDCETTPTDGWIDGFTIDNNEVYSNGWKGLSIISARNGIIENNLIYKNGSSAGAIHLVAQTGPCGAYTSDNVTIMNNTVIEPTQAAIRITGGNNGVFFNNILISSSPWVNEYGGTQYHNTASSIERSSSTGLFVNASSNNYHLINSSSAINIGVQTYQSMSAPIIDRDGNTRPSGGAYDAGAYEYADTSTKVPKPPTNLKVLP